MRIYILQETSHDISYGQRDVVNSYYSTEALAKQAKTECINNTRTDEEPNEFIVYSALVDVTSGP